MLGKTLGHYQILDKLGSGGMGDVHRALDTKLDRELALKKMVYEGAITRELLRLDPKWDPLGENPRFERLMAGVSS